MYEHFLRLANSGNEFFLSSNICIFHIYILNIVNYFFILCTISDEDEDNEVNVDDEEEDEEEDEDADEEVCLNMVTSLNPVSN